jgi:hypothetical protein
MGMTSVTRGLGRQAMTHSLKTVASIACALIAVAAGLISTDGAASAAPSEPPGYWMLGGDGGVFTFGTSFAGSPAADPRLCPANTSDRREPNGTCWSMAPTPDGRGYWVLNGDTGVIYPFGDAGLFGDPAASFVGVPREFVPNSLAIVATPTGKGYWALEAGLSGLGSVMAFGDAPFFGDPVSQKLPHAGEPVGLAATADGKGYWIVDSDGGVFTFGDAPFLGSMGGRHLNAPVVAIASTPDGRGYYLAAADGGVFTFGDATFAGSMGGTRLHAPVIGVAVAPVTGGGYWLAAADGGVFSFGQAPFRGSLGATHLDRPIFAIVASRAVS